MSLRRGSQQIAVVLSIGCPLQQGEPDTGQLNQVRKIGAGLTTQMHREMGSGSMETKEKEKGAKRSKAAESQPATRKVPTKSIHVWIHPGRAASASSTTPWGVV